MQLTSRFTIAVHIITCIDYFKEERRVTSDFLAGSVGVNPVVIRTVLAKLREAGIVSTRQGSGGASLLKSLDQITFYDIYKAVDCVDETGLFHFHENPNMDCPVGRNIHSAMDNRLGKVQDAMECQMKQITLEDIVSDVKIRVEKNSND